MELIKYKYKSYGHFDNKTKPEVVKRLVENPEWVKKHGFYPFAHYQIIFKKFDGKERKPPKIRNIYYSSHIDRYIYQYYSYLLNEKYNEKVNNLNINEYIVAYRNNLHKNNIHFAKNAFNILNYYPQCYVMIGDFTDFFENLDHKYLKSKICDVLGVKTLTDDWYKVFKSITKYSFIDILKVAEYNKVTFSRAKRDKFFKDIIEFKNNKNHFLKYNTKKYGIPQGSPISAIFANVYLIEIDKEIIDLLKKYNGFYQRYSDDFIIILPNVNIDTAKNIFNNIKEIVATAKSLTLKESKTNYYFVYNKKVKSCNNDFCSIPNIKDEIDYLGFTMNDYGISIRSKTILKYYYKAYRFIKKLKDENSKVTVRKIYVRYTKDGIPFKYNPKKRNFITYANSVKRIYGYISNDNVIKNHKNNIGKRINKTK